VLLFVRLWFERPKSWWYTKLALFFIIVDAIHYTPPTIALGPSSPSIWGCRSKSSCFMREKSHYESVWHFTYTLKPSPPNPPCQSHYNETSVHFLPLLCSAGSYTRSRAFCWHILGSSARCHRAVSNPQWNLLSITPRSLPCHSHICGWHGNLQRHQRVSILVYMSSFILYSECFQWGLMNKLKVFLDQPMFIASCPAHHHITPPAHHPIALFFMLQRRSPLSHWISCGRRYLLLRSAGRYIWPSSSLLHHCGYESLQHCPEFRRDLTEW